MPNNDRWRDPGIPLDQLGPVQRLHVVARTWRREDPDVRQYLCADGPFAGSTLPGKAGWRLYILEPTDGAERL